MRIPIYEDEDFKFEYSLREGCILLHCEVFNWKISSLKKGRKVFEEFKEKKAREGYRFLLSFSPNPKFCKLLGGEYLGSKAHKGKQYEVFRWVLIH